MMNNVENKNDLNKMSDLEFGKNKVEMMRYRTNSLSYKLGFGGLALSILAGFFCLNGFNPTNFNTFIAIMLNIIILLAGFLSIEKAKSYSLQGSIALIVIGAVCGARIFWIPLQLILEYNKWVSAGKPTDTKPYPYLGATIYSKNTDQLVYLPQSGTFRGIIAIVCLVFAAALFIFAGYIGVVRSKKLTTYLNSINQKKVGGK